MEEISNLKELLIYVANEYEEKILYRQKEITYKDFKEKVNVLGTALINIGLKDKKIGIISENRYEWEVSFFSIACGAGIVVPIDKSLTKVEIENIINRAKIEAIFCSSKYEKILQEIKESNQYLKYVISFDSTDDNAFYQLISKGQTSINNGDRRYIDAKVNSNDICLISFTSGTTNISKAVPLTHKNICSNLINVSKVFKLTKKDICLSILPLNHVLEGLFCFLLSIYNGSERVHCNQIDDIIDYIRKYKITYMGGVPAIYEYLNKRKDELIKETEHINMFMSGGANLPPELVLKYREIGIDLVQGYGLTECSPVVSIENKESQKLGSVR